MTTDLTIYVAVDDKGCGYVLAWMGSDERVGDALSVAEAFGEEVSNQGRYCEDLLLTEPKAPGLHRFDGTMFYPWNPDPDGAEPEYRGEWTAVHLIPSVFPITNEVT